MRQIPPITDNNIILASQLYVKKKHFLIRKSSGLQQSQLMAIHHYEGVHKSQILTYSIHSILTKCSELV